MSNAPVVVCGQIVTESAWDTSVLTVYCATEFVLRESQAVKETPPDGYGEYVTWILPDCDTHGTGLAPCRRPIACAPRPA